MRKTRITLLIILALGFSALPLSLFVIAEPIFVIPDYEAVDWQSGLAGDVNLPAFDPDTVSSEYFGTPSGESKLRMATPSVGTMVYDWYVSLLTENPYMTLRAVGDFVEVWVQNDLSFPTGDPRNDDTDLYEVTDDMAEYLANEFDNNIYATLAGYFGSPDDRDGTGTIFEASGWPSFTWDWIETTDPYNPQRVILKIINYQDENYNDPTYPSYVAGFFSSGYTDYYNRNMVHLDSWAWVNRLGPEDTQWIADRPDLVVTRPNLYESVLAHEFQHNIHSDIMPGDDTYMNEGSSLFSEPLCGYKLDTGQIEWFLATPDNSLTEWGDQGEINILADYGAAFLWTLYLTDHYGVGLIGDYVKNGNAGIDGINALLEPYGVDFYEVFQDWTIANLIHTDNLGDGKYNYVSIDLAGIQPIRWNSVEGEEVDWTLGSSFPTITAPWSSYPDGYSLGNLELNPFGTDYIRFPNLRTENKISFDGDDLANYPAGWTTFESEIPGDRLDGAWWSGPELELKDVLLAGEVDVPNKKPTLDLLTLWDIEDYWDFGFVQVSTDGGNTWTSLGNEYTTGIYDPQAWHAIVDNLPGLTSYITKPISMSFDLSAYAGETVQIGFRFMTDWGFEYAGWYILDAKVGHKSFELAPVPKQGDFMVAVVEVEITPSGNSIAKQVIKMSLNDATEIGEVLARIRSEVKDAIIIISSKSEFGTVDYKFKTEIN